MVKRSTYKVLKLNQGWFPIDVCDWQTIIPNLFPHPITNQQSLKPARVEMEDGVLSNLTVFNDIKDWIKLAPGEDDNFVQTGNGPFIVPRVVVCSKYDRIPQLRAQFPTKKNIWKRDGYICGYSGSRLTKANLSMDHIIPSSKGGEDTWENLITCDRQLNSKKSDMSVEEAGLKLLWKPTRPKNGLIFDLFDDAWKTLVH